MRTGILKGRVITIFFSLLLIGTVASCGDPDPQPVNNQCEKAKLESQQATAAFNAHVKTHPGANAAPYELEKFQTKSSELRATMEAKQSAMSKACSQ